MKTTKLFAGSYVYKFESGNTYDVIKNSSGSWEVFQNGGLVERFEKKSEAVRTVKLMA